MKRHARWRLRPVTVMLANLLIFTVIVVLCLAYTRQSNDKLYEQNLNDIQNVNQAAAQIASEMFSSHERKLANIQHYLSRHPMSAQQLMDYIDDSNADSNVTFQLIGTDYKGCVLRKDASGAYPAVSYENSDYDRIQQIVDASGETTDRIPFTVEFTDPHTGSRSFARYLHISAMVDREERRYTLMAVYQSAAFIGHINLDSGFAKLSTVLINPDGSYALRNLDFKSESLFKYLYVYNDLTLDEMSEIQRRVLASDGGVLRYQNSEGEPCVFVYASVPGTDWYCVSCVPLSSFHTANPDFRLTAMLVLLLALALTLDVAYLSELNRRLKTSAQEANAASEAKTDFLARMSHDIRTPINVITGMTELALGENNPAPTTEYLANIRSSGRFLLGLVNDILDMNKVESGKMELHLRPYRFSDLTTYLNAVIRPLCDEKQIEFTLSGNLQGMTLMTDPLRLNQIFFNLLSNAAKFTPAKGHISFTAVARELAEHRSGIDFTVRDDGAGMSEAFQLHMFSAFSQEERTEAQNTGGTGLGLAIVKNLVELMNGEITVESAVGKGSAFVIHLEMETRSERELPAEADTAAADLAGRRVLLCEDHPLNAKIIVQLLGRRQVQVDVAENGRVGVERFAASPAGTYDAVLMDIRMPVMNGLEAAKAIRALGRADSAGVPIVALTANAYDSDVQSCIQAGMDAHLAKPVDTQKLCGLLSQLLARPARKDEKP